VCVELDIVIVPEDATPFVCLHSLHSTPVIDSHETLIAKQVYQGYFNILFLTHFPVMENLYRAITGKFDGSYVA
jgi:hypothetical protein